MNYVVVNPAPHISLHGQFYCTSMGISPYSGILIKPSISLFLELVGRCPVIAACMDIILELICTKHRTG